MAPEDVIAPIAVVVADGFDVPYVAHGGVAVVAVVDDTAIGRAEEGEHRAIVVAPQDIVAAVPVEIAGAGNMPGTADGSVDVVAVVEDAATGSTEEVGDGTIGVAEQDVVPSIAVEVANPRNMPRIGDVGVEVVRVAGEPARGGPQIIED